MTLPRKGRRRIVVGGIEYRWTIRKKPTRVQADYDGGCLNVAVQRSVPPAKLIIHTKALHPQNVFTPASRPVRPGDVRRWIEAGIRLGWLDSSVSVFVVREEDDGSVSRENPSRVRDLSRRVPPSPSA